MDQLRDGRCDLTRAVRHERPVVRIRRGRQATAEAGAIAHLTRVTLARPHRIAAVVGRRIAEHVEEQPVDLIAVERLRQNRHRVLPVVVAVDARRIEAVVNGRLTVRTFEEPLRVRVEDCLLRLAQIEAADNSNAAGACLPKDVAEQVTARRQECARIVKRDACGVLRDDAAHVDEEGVGGKLGDGGDERLRVERRVRFAQVGLEESDRLVEPPLGLSRGAARGESQDAGTSGRPPEPSRAE